MNHYEEKAREHLLASRVVASFGRLCAEEIEKKYAALKELVEEWAGFDCDRAAPQQWPKLDCSCGPCRARRVLVSLESGGKEKP